MPFGLANVLDFAGSAGAGIANTLVGINQARINRQFQLDMSNTAWQRGVTDMRAAGINPMVAFSQGGASTPSGANAGPGQLDTASLHNAFELSLQREEQDNRNKVADAQARKLSAEATKEETWVPAYQWGQKLLLDLKPYADDVVAWVKTNLNDAKTGKLGDDLAKWADDHNLGVSKVPNPLKSETWSGVGKAIADAVSGAVTKGATNAKQAATDLLDNAKNALRNHYTNLPAFKKHDTSKPLSAKDPALRGLPGVPKE